MQTKERLAYVDLFRGVGILLMVMGHIYFSGIFDKFIHAFHMPMFFFVTGYFFKPAVKGSIHSFLCKKSKALMVPYAVFGVFHFIVWLGLNWGERSFEPLRCLFFENTSDGIAKNAAGEPVARRNRATMPERRASP